MKVVTALVDTIYYDSSPADEREECEVRFGDNEIVISYEDDDGEVLYKGKDYGHGHYVLKCPERRGKATLHRIPDSKYMEGYWSEEGARGFWRFTLP